tara:strand:- start:590 stop:916 length:327 start_codon:yes stop_codon:yes gene_type:complete
MNAKHNPLRNIQDMQVRHMVLQALAWMWCIAFSLMIGDLMFFGTTLIAHTVLIMAIVITVTTFQAAKRRPQSFNFIKGYHSMGRSRGAVWINGKKTVLPDGDPGGEHE